jgi:hypothetical protein
LNRWDEFRVGTSILITHPAPLYLDIRETQTRSLKSRDRFAMPNSSHIVRTNDDIDMIQQNLVYLSSEDELHQSVSVAFTICTNK